jgi:TatD DNase family protein
MRLVDTHIHLTDKRFRDDFDDLLDRSRKASVDRWITIGTTPKDGAAARSLAEKNGGMFFACAIHPHQSQEWDASCPARFRELLAHKKAVALGEIGLDYHYDFSPRDVQKRAFEEQLALADELDLPIIIHCRESFRDISAILKAHKTEKLRGVVHCFSEGRAEAEQLFELGFYIGLGGAMTYPKSDAIRAAAAAAPADRLLLETDAPYLAPPPHRGKRNEPSYVPFIAEVLAKARKVSVEEIARLTSENAARLFRTPELASS